MSEAATTTKEQKDGATTTLPDTPPAEVEKTTTEKETSTDASADKGTDDKGTDDIAVDAVNMLAQGKRNMVCGEVPTAVNQLQEACKLLSIKYGETADECAEAYFCYGKALLDLSRMESGVLGNALQGMSEDEEDEKSAESSEDKGDDSDKMPEEEREKISDQVIDAMLERDDEKKDGVKKDGEKEGEKTDGEKKEEQEKKTEESDKKDAKSEETSMETEDSKEKPKEDKAEKKDAGDKKDTESEGKEGDTEEEEGESEDIGETEEEGQEEGDSQGEGEDDAKKEEEEDISNLQLAWEMLELAKIIYRRHDSKEMKLKLAETNLKLGEVGLETEQYEQALGDFLQCLKLQKELLEPEDRLLAETYYQLGLAATYSCRYDEAIDYYKCAAKCIESKIALLNKVLEKDSKDAGKGKAKADVDSPTFKADKEIKELQEILPDIMSKIDDVEDEKKSADRVKQLVKENVAQDLGTTTTGFGSAAASSPTKAASSASSADSSSQSKASDISHLVRKKRKTEAEEEETDESTKKQKTDEAKTSGDKSNGDAAKSNGHANGAANGATNGEMNGKPSPEKTEIKTKTVEEVKQKSEEKMETS